jgi:exodeoxyribonuclease V gamma subunit
MSWKLMTLLPQRLDDDDFTLLRHYLSDDSDKRKLFQLAARVADLYDQYLVYRPEWLMRWEADQRVDGLGDAQQWQAPLWKALVEYTAELGQPQWHRANLYQRFISALEAADEPPAGLPSRVFICGISALPPVYLQALQALGKHVDVYVLFTNPCRYYWGDIKDPAFLAKLLSRQRRHHRERASSPVSRYEQAPGLFNDAGEQDVGNPLLASWGKLGRDYIYLLAGWSAMKSWTPLSISRRITCCIIFRRIFSNCAMRRWPGEREEFAHSRSKRPLALDDRSLTIHVCHSPQREVEVLHDRLLAMLERIRAHAARYYRHGGGYRQLQPLYSGGVRQRQRRALAAVGDLRPARPRIASGAAGVYHAAFAARQPLCQRRCAGAAGCAGAGRAL